MQGRQDPKKMVEMKFKAMRKRDIQGRGKLSRHLQPTATVNFEVGDEAEDRRRS